mmetsp:Transcript_3828/g.7338  ORF Transcript_3828/g.7338 Transcript_3828/m.7338 type:complete len:80 (+) Transcript_3828:186-425(+)
MGRMYQATSFPCDPFHRLSPSSLTANRHKNKHQKHMHSIETSKEIILVHLSRTGASDYCSGLPTRRKSSIQPRYGFICG